MFAASSLVWYASVLLAVILVAVTSGIFVPVGELNQYETSLKRKLGDNKIAQLLNANPISNLPTVKIENAKAFDPFENTCATGGFFVGTDAATTMTDHNQTMCTTRCGENGRLVAVEKDGSYVLNGTSLATGVWCVRNPPFCDYKTQIAVATAYGEPTCLTIFPNLADPCTNEKGEKVAVLQDNTPNVPYTSESESGRFSCTDIQDDEMSNKYIPQTINPFRLIRDPCKREVIGASREVYTSLDWTNGSYKCICGNPVYTKVDNKDRNDPKSTCTPCYNSFEDGRFGYRCIKYNSPLSEMYDFPLCTPTKFSDTSIHCMSRINSDLVTKWKPLVNNLGVYPKGLVDFDPDESF